MFYTGLEIARSLGGRGIPVLGLTAQRGVYGNATRFAKTQFVPDSKLEPEALLTSLLAIGRSLPCRGILFPTRDHDLVFLDRFRAQLEPYFSLVMPGSGPLETCLNKWETFVSARNAGIDAPWCLAVEDRAGLESALGGIAYPCVLKPVAAHHWREAGRWALVGGRKAIVVRSEAELLAEYTQIARAEKRVLIQQLVPGPDSNLEIVGCYIDSNSKWAAGFTAQKLAQSPEGFGTGCILRTADRNGLFERTRTLLEAMRFTGMAEVEYKWDAKSGKYYLIEINPRPWDQLALGRVSGVDLSLLAYADHAAMPAPALNPDTAVHKWIAEDAFVIESLRLAWRRDRRFFSLLKLAAGHRTYAIWSPRDPLPFLSYLTQGLPSVLGGLLKAALAKARPAGDPHGQPATLLSKPARERR